MAQVRHVFALVGLKFSPAIDRLIICGVIVVWAEGESTAVPKNNVRIITPKENFLV